MTQDILNQLASESDKLHIDQYFGIWSILEEPLREGVTRFGRLNLLNHVATQRARIPAQPIREHAGSYEIRDGVALIELIGVLMKQVSSLSGGSSTVLARRQVRHTTANDHVRAIVLKIDSPGGTVAGTFDLADDVAAAAKKKPVVAYIEDLGASAGYAIAAQATKIYANRTALVGSIGTYMMIYDESKRAEKMGVKVHVLRAGTFKGAGVAGTEITPGQLEMWQRLVDEMNAFFIKAVASGRHRDLAWAQRMADGRVHLAAEAAKLGLIDGVKSFDQTLAILRKETEPKGQQHQTSPPVDQAGSVNSTRPVQQVPASSLVTSATERKKTMPSQTDLDTIAIDTFNRLVKERMGTGITRKQASMAVARENPAAHKAFIRATNRGKDQSIVNSLV